MLLVFLLLSVSCLHQFSASLSFMCNLFVWLTSSYSHHHRRAAHVCVSPSLFCAIFGNICIASSARSTPRLFSFFLTSSRFLSLLLSKINEKGGVCVPAGGRWKVGGRRPSAPPLHLQWSSLKPSSLLFLLSTSLDLISIRNENLSPVLAEFKRIWNTVDRDAHGPDIQPIPHLSNKESWPGPALCCLVSLCYLRLLP